MDEPLQSNSRTVRIAASLFFFVCLPMYFWEQNFVRAKIFVAQDPVATAGNLLANEFGFRVATITHLGGTIVFVFMILMLHRVFRPVDKYLSRLMIAAVLVQVPVILLLEIFDIGALMILKSEARPTFDVIQQQEAAYLLLRLQRVGIGTSKLFFGLCFIPFGMVVLKSGITPRIIGILFIIGGVGYVGDFCIYVLLQRPDYIMVRSILMYSYFGWMVALLWLLVKGVRSPAPVQI